MNDKQFETIDLTELGAVVGGNFRSRLKKALHKVEDAYDYLFGGSSGPSSPPPGDPIPGPVYS